MRRPNRSIEERLWERIDQTAGPVACWPYNGPRLPRGYGQLHVRQPDGRYIPRLAHRITFEVVSGKKIPMGMMICHHCDNPPCCNPAHLFLGRAIDNVRDMRAKGRAPIGERHGAAQLTERDVIEMRAMRHAGTSSIEIARRFGCTANVALSVVAGESWSHLNDVAPPVTRHRLRGEGHWEAKLTVERVREIRRNVNGETYADFARRFGVSHSAVIQAAKRHTWKDA